VNGFKSHRQKVKGTRMGFCMDDDLIRAGFVGELRGVEPRLIMMTRLIT